MTDEHHHDWPLVHHQSARLQKCCMKPVQSLFLLVLAPSQLAACGFTAQILTYPTCFQIFKQKEDCSQSKFGSLIATKPENPSSLECKVLMSQMSHESWVMSQWVRSEKITVSVETIKLSITFTYFVYFLHCCLHKADFWQEISTLTWAVC